MVGVGLGSRHSTAPVKRLPGMWTRPGMRLKSLPTLWPCFLAEWYLVLSPGKVTVVA